MLRDLTAAAAAQEAAQEMCCDPSRYLCFLEWGFPKIRGTHFGVPNNKDYSILGSILGSPPSRYLCFLKCGYWSKFPIIRGPIFGFPF